MTARPPAVLYDDDFYAWTQAQARELRRFARSRPNLPLDLAHIAEETADLGTERRNRLLIIRTDPPLRASAADGGRPP